MKPLYTLNYNDEIRHGMSAPVDFGLYLGTFTSVRVYAWCSLKFQ